MIPSKGSLSREKRVLIRMVLIRMRVLIGMVLIRMRALIGMGAIINKTKKTSEGGGGALIRKGRVLEGGR